MESETEDHEAIEDDEAVFYEEYTPEVDAQTNEQKLEIVFLPQEAGQSSTQAESPSTSMSREEKFINAVYPHFRGKTKLQLIEEILDLKRINEQLQVKAKNYENTINRLLNWSFCLILISSPINFKF